LTIIPLRASGKSAQPEFLMKKIGIIGGGVSSYDENLVFLAV
jgi:hypothetical protein